MRVEAGSTSSNFTGIFGDDSCRRKKVGVVASRPLLLICSKAESRTTRGRVFWQRFERDYDPDRLRSDVSALFLASFLLLG